MQKTSRGFTVVEILIVTVVIGLLATLSFIMYNGMNKRAQDSSIASDLREMDVAQGYYMVKHNRNKALPVNPDGSVNDLLVFASNPGNTVIVKLDPSGRGYCIYGYSPRSNHPNLSQAMVRSSNSNSTCPPLGPESSIITPANVLSTVSIIGGRLEAYKQSHGHYPHTNELQDIGLILKPNAENANQQQLYCRDDLLALYLQIDKVSNPEVVYVYETATKNVSQQTGLPKLSLTNICPIFDIHSTSPGYESTGIKNPDITLP